jgi:hypothetical protein
MNPTIEPPFDKDEDVTKPKRDSCHDGNANQHHPTLQLWSPLFVAAVVAAAAAAAHSIVMVRINDHGPQECDGKRKVVAIYLGPNRGRRAECSPL